jgi:hypothetical protein
VVHHDTDLVIIGERLGSEIAEHPQMAMLTIHTIFRGVMRMKRRHGFAAMQIEV